MRLLHLIPFNFHKILLLTCIRKRKKYFLPKVTKHNNKNKITLFCLKLYLELPTRKLYDCIVHSGGNPQKMS